MIKLLYLLLILNAISSNSCAQVNLPFDIDEYSSKDTTPNFYLCDTITALADSIYPHIIANNLEYVLKYTPSYDYLKESFDSLDIKNMRPVIVTKQKYIRTNLTKDLKLLHKKSKTLRINLKRIEKIETHYNYGTHNGNNYCYVTYVCKRNKKFFYISFVALEINQNWFISDELKLILPDQDKLKRLNPVKISE